MSNLRPGVQILIDQLANNPDEFFGDLDLNRRLTIGGRSGKFSHWRNIIETELLTGVRGNEEKTSRVYTWFLSDEEKAALRDAYTEACKVRFDTEMIALLAEKPEATVQYREAMRLDSNGTLGIGTTHATTLSNSGYFIHGGQK